MRLHRFFVEEKLQPLLDAGKEFATEDRELIHQWKDVFRLRVGEKIILLDNTGFEFYCTLILVSKDRTVALIDEVKECKKNGDESRPEIHLYASVIKKDNFEWILEKGTELGVTRFVPIISGRSEKKNLNIERANKIIKEASEQSGRGILPTLAEVTPIKDVLMDESVSFVAFHLSGEKLNVDAFSKKKKIGLLIGPEGGWTDEEVDMFTKASIPVVSVGSCVLRAETAAIAIASLFLL